MIYSTLYEVIVDFTREYEIIRQALKKIEHYDKICLEKLLEGLSDILTTNWGTQNYCQILVLTDCGLGFGKSSIKKLVSTIVTKKQEGKKYCIPFLTPSKLSFICIGTNTDSYFTQAVKIYRQLLDVSGQKGHIFIPKSNDNIKNQNEIIKNSIKDMIERMCETNFKQFEATLKCGGYHRLECPILMWPPPLPYNIKDNFGKDIVKTISKTLEVCGFLSLSDIGSPVSVSRHLVVPKQDFDKTNKKTVKTKNPTPGTFTNDIEKLENEIRSFYSKTDGNNSDEDDNKLLIQNDSHRESVCVLLHGALKVENMAALVLLNDNWFGFINSYADSKKKFNLMLNVLPPGNDVIPWIGDMRLLGHLNDKTPGENANFPIKAEKRSYSQNCVVWIKQAALQSDIQKVLRHAKKLPEKTPHFYKELNRIRRAALSIGFVELLEGLANIFDREVAVLPPTASPDCAIQMKHAAIELRKIVARDLKTIITAQPTKYNQL